MNLFPQLIVNSLITSSFYILLGIGFNLQYSTTKFFNLSYGTTAILGGYITLFFLQHGFPILASIAISLLVTSFLGFCLEKGLYLRLRNKKSTHLNLLIASLGISITFEALIAILFSPQIQTIYQYVNHLQVIRIALINVTLIQLITICNAVIIFILTLILYKKTSFGKVIRAISDDEEAAEIVGINTHKVIGLTFFLATFISAIAGIGTGFDIGLQPTLGFSLLLKGIIVAIIGGLGNIMGGLIGALLLGFIENFSIIFLPGEWTDAIAFGVLILVLLIKPRGIFSK